MTLMEEALLAERIADALLRFKEPNPEHVQDIIAAISALNALSWALREIDNLVENGRSDLAVVENDLKMVHTSVSVTLGDIWEIIGSIGDRRPVLYDEDFQTTWKNICRYCRDWGKVALHIRLESYRRFTLALCQILKHTPPAPQEFNTLQSELRLLMAPYRNRDGRLPPPQTQPAPADDLVARKQRSYERRRDEMSPSGSSDSRPQGGAQFGAAPSPPTSPTNTFSSASQVSSVEFEGDHWARDVFREMSATHHPLNNELCRYHDMPDHPNNGIPSERYKECIALSFPPNLRVSLHAKHKGRAKMLVKWPAAGQREAVICLPLEMLELHRHGSVLRFCRWAADRKTQIAWVSLNFSTIERLILFANTFVALKSASGFGPRTPLWQDAFKDETEIYDGVVITSSGRRHTIAVVRDRPSGAIRLQAAVRGGPQSDTPIWTSFITHNIASPSWCERVDTRVVLLRDMRPHVFAHRGGPERTPSGGYCIRFEHKADAKMFASAMEDLGKQARRGPRRA